MVERFLLRGGTIFTPRWNDFYSAVERFLLRGGTIFTPRWNDFYLMMERINIRQAGRYDIKYPYLYCIVKKGHSFVCMLVFIH